MPKLDKQINFFLSAEMLNRIWHYAEKYQVTKSQAIRMLINYALTDLDGHQRGLDNERHS